MAKALTIGDLKRYMAAHGLSPERVASATQISNMTIRRLLKKKESLAVPPRYQLQVRAFLQAGEGKPSPDGLATLIEGNGLELGGGDFRELLEELRESGENCKDAARVEESARSKLGDPSIGNALKENVRKILEAVRSKEVGLKERALGVGALLYFVNPFDLVPDAIPGVGYVDDFAVLMIVVALLTGAARPGGGAAPSPGKGP